MSNKAPGPFLHDHPHGMNRFAVLPTPVRLRAETCLTGKGVTIAVIDSGFHPHPDLTEPANRIITFEDVTQPGVSLTAALPPQSWDWHGTQTSVVAAGNGYLSDGVYRGLASDARLVLIKVSDRGRITEENIARGLEWVIRHKDRFNIRVANISLGGDQDVPHASNAVDRAAEEAVKQGVVVVAAAGNAGNQAGHTPVPPANAPSVITVGGYDDGNRIDAGLSLYWSSFGPTSDGFLKPELIAPAIWIAAPILSGTEAYDRAEALSRIASAPDYMLESLIRLSGRPDYVLGALASGLWQRAGLPDCTLRLTPAEIRGVAELQLKEHKIVATHYQHVDGTSFAAPIVASVAAQMIQANPSLTPAAIKHILISTADRIGGAPALRQGYGVLNARNAVEQARKERHADDACFLCPPRIEGGKLVFTYHDDAATAVALAGDFNGWNPEKTRFRRTDAGAWRAEIDPPALGDYRYKFVIDGKRWIDDPANAHKVDDNYGGFNSLIGIADGPGPAID